MHLFKAIVFAAALPVAAQAQFFPGRVDEALVGDWQCGETRAYITSLGSIELISDGYRAGLFDAADGVMKILWDEGGQTEWTYTAENGAMTLAAPEDEKYSCVPRK